MDQFSFIKVKFSEGSPLASPNVYQGANNISVTNQPYLSIVPIQRWQRCCVKEEGDEEFAFTLDKNRRWDPLNIQHAHNTDH